MSNLTSVSLRPHIPKPAARAEELVSHVVGEYRHIARTIGPEKSVNLVCSVGGREFDVYSIGRLGDLLSLMGKTEDGTEFKTYASVELVSFTIILSKKAQAEPPREIGFHAEMKAQGAE
jgi:hypothetical protein